MPLLNNFVLLFVESAPFLLLGMFIAGLIHHFIPQNWVEKTLGGKSSVLNAALIGAPLPLCSCSVIPVAMGIRRSGASKASTASFLVATPETGVDSIGITYALMGPVMAIARPIAAIFSALCAGYLVHFFGQVDKTEEQVKVESGATKSCCDSEPPISAPKTCCNSKASKSAGFRQKMMAVFTFGFGQLLRDFMLWFLIGIFFAALVTTLLPPEFLSHYGQGVFAMLLVVLVSIPMYVCATASTPIAVGLLLSGVSPGAALVFMLTGPATNIATLMIIKNELGKRELSLYLIAIISSAIASGLLLNWLFMQFNWQLNLAHGEHSPVMGVVYQGSAIVLAGLIIIQMQKIYLPKVVNIIRSNVQGS